MAGCYFFTASNSGLLFSDGAVAGFPNFNFTLKLTDCIHTETCHHVTLNSDVLTFTIEHDLDGIKMKQQAGI